MRLKSEPGLRKNQPPTLLEFKSFVVRLDTGDDVKDATLDMLCYDTRPIFFQLVKVFQKL